MIALTWIAVISILFLWWPNNKYTVQGNLGFGLLLVVYYAGWARRRCTGPRTLSSDELARRELVVGEAHGIAD